MFVLTELLAGMLLLCPSACQRPGEYDTDFQSDRSADFSTFVQVGTKGLHQPTGHGSYDWQGDLSLHGRYGTDVGVVLKQGGANDDGVFDDVVVTIEFEYARGQPDEIELGVGLRLPREQGANNFPLYHVALIDGQLLLQAWSGYSTIQTLDATSLVMSSVPARYRLVASAINRGSTTLVDLTAALYEDDCLIARLEASETELRPNGYVGLYAGEGPGNTSQWRGIDVKRLRVRSGVFATNFQQDESRSFHSFVRIGNRGETLPGAPIRYDWSSGLELTGSQGAKAAVLLAQSGPVDDGRFRDARLQLEWTYLNGTPLNTEVGLALRRASQASTRGASAYVARLIEGRFELGLWEDPSPHGSGQGLGYLPLVSAQTKLQSAANRFRIEASLFQEEQGDEVELVARLYERDRLRAILRTEIETSLTEGLVGFYAGPHPATQPVYRGARIESFSIHPDRPIQTSATVRLESERFLSVRMIDRDDRTETVDLTSTVFSNVQNYWISSEQDPNYRTPRNPLRVGRRSEQHYAYPWKGGIPWDADMAHIAYLELPVALQEGLDYRLRVARVTSHDFERSLSWSLTETLNTNLKVNQVGYLPRVKRKLAYVGGYLGDLGPLPAGELGGRSFQVRDKKSGQVVYKGKLKLRKLASEIDDQNRNFSGEDLFEADFGALQQPGRYFVTVPGLGRSDTFEIGHEIFDPVYRTTARALYHQRHGVALLPQHTAYPRGATHDYRSQPTAINNRDCDDCFLELQSPSNWEPGKIKSHAGGWWDAGDWDSRYQHFLVIYLLADLYELFPARFGDAELGLPESGNDIPDLLDEAWFGLKLYLGMQAEDEAAGRGAGIRGGQNMDRNAPWILPETYQGPWYAYAQGATTSFEYAAVAAKLARNLEAFVPNRASEILASAERAYLWAAQKFGTAKAHKNLARAAAAVELFETTGKQAYHQDFLFHYPLSEQNWTWQYKHVAWTYLRSKRPGLDAALRREARDDLLRWADRIATRQELQGYRNARVRSFDLAWHETGTSVHYAADLIRGWWIDRNRIDWLQAALDQVNYQLGANPLALSWITGIGQRYPMRPLHLQSFADEIVEPVPGINIYGHAQGSFGNSKAVQDSFYPDKSVYPPFRMFTDSNPGAVMHAEFTVHENIAWTVFVYGFLSRANF